MSDSIQMTLHPEAPWLGLHSYDELSREYFFGRDEEITALADRIRLHGLTLLFGQSGLGKTSLLRAGVIPVLNDGIRVPILIRLDYNDFAEPLQTQVINQIIAQIPAWKRDELDATASCNVNSSLWQFLAIPPIATGSLGVGQSLPKLALLFDQFEEIWTHGEKRLAESNDFIETLACIVEGRTPQSVRDRMEVEEEIANRFASSPIETNVLLVLRDDYLHMLERWRDRMPSMMSSRFELRALAGPQAFLAVREPARKRACLDPTLPPIISDETAEDIVREAAGVPPNTPLATVENVPPLLSLLCEQLNAKRINQGSSQILSESLGTSARTVLQDFYQACFSEFASTVQNYFEENLVSTTGGHRESITLQSAIDDLRILGIVSPDDVIARLVQHRLLTIDQRGGVARLELTHDVLGPIAWRTRTERKEADARLAISFQAANRRWQRLKTASYCVIVGAFLVSSVLACVAWFERSKAIHLSKTSVVLKQEAERQRVIADQEKTKAQRLVKLAGKTHFFNGTRLINASPRHDIINGSTIGARSIWQEGIANWCQALQLDPDNQVATRELYAAFSSLQTPTVPDHMISFPQPITAVYSGKDQSQIAFVASTTAYLSQIDLFYAPPTVIEVDQPIRQCVFAKENRFIALLLQDGQIALWNATTNEIDKHLTIPDPANNVLSICFSPDGQWLVANSVLPDRQYFVYSMATGNWGKGQRTETEIVESSFIPSRPAILHCIKGDDRNLWEVWARTLGGNEGASRYTTCSAPIKHIRVADRCQRVLIVVDMNGSVIPIGSDAIPQFADPSDPEVLSQEGFGTSVLEASAPFIEPSSPASDRADDQSNAGSASATDAATIQSVNPKRALKEQINVISMESWEVITSYSYTSFENQLFASNSQLFIDDESAIAAIFSEPLRGTGCGATTDEHGRMHIIDLAKGYTKNYATIDVMPDNVGFLSERNIMCTHFPDGRFKLLNVQNDDQYPCSSKKAERIVVASRNRFIAIDSKVAILWRVGIDAPSTVQLSPDPIEPASISTLGRVTPQPPASETLNDSHSLSFNDPNQTVSSWTVASAPYFVSTNAPIEEPPLFVEPATAELTQSENADESFSLLITSPDSCWIAALSSKGQVALWDVRQPAVRVADGKLPISKSTRRLPAIPGLTEISFSSDGALLLMSATYKTKNLCENTVYSKTDLQVVYSSTGLDCLPLVSGLQQFKFDADHSRLLTIDLYGNVTLYSLKPTGNANRSIRIARDVEGVNFEATQNSIRFQAAMAQEHERAAIRWFPDGRLSTAESDTLAVNDEVVNWCRSIAGLEFSIETGNLIDQDDFKRFDVFYKTDLPTPWAELRERMVVGRQ